MKKLLKQESQLKKLSRAKAVMLELCMLIVAVSHSFRNFLLIVCIND
jgi:hypothetical protein